MVAVKKALQKAEHEGRGGDRILGHLTPGDIVIPRGMQTPEMRQALAGHFDLDTYTAGHEKNSLNPLTGLPEFNDDAGGGGGGFDSVGNDNAGKNNADGSNAGGVNPGLGDGQGSLGPDSALNNDNSKGWGGINSQNGGWLEGILGNLAHPDAVGPSAMDAMGTGGGIDSNGGATNQLQAAAAPPPLALGTVPPLNNPLAPDVPDSVPQLGQYYALLSQGNTAAAQQLLQRFMRGDTNVYGR